jgi:AcrR family transcriptional regulator
MSIQWCMEQMADDRLGPEDWVRAGLKALATSGFTALKADALAKVMGVSRGSFYWHFADVDAFQAAILQRWREIALERIVSEIDRLSHDRLETLIQRAFGSRTSLEIAVRAWATAEPKARDAVDEVDAERVRYLRKLLLGAGVEAAAATTRAHILNWAYLGYALSSARLDKRALQHVVDELSYIARSPRRRRGATVR